MDIDFVIDWVDGNDSVWQKRVCQYKGLEYKANNVRYRDWDILRYWFRAVEAYAPWVHNIYFVADNQRPDWLNFDNPKLQYTDHKDFIPNEYLPTFNTNTIELNFHRIKGLAEHFVAFNDDMYINAPVSPCYYFKEGLPCDATLEHLFSGRGYDKIDKWGISIMDFCNTQVLNAHFNRKEVVKGNFKRWYGSYLNLKYQLQAFAMHSRSEFQHLYTPHVEKPLLKSVYNEIWCEEAELLEKSCTRFRENTNLTIYLMRYWQLAANKFHPSSDFKNKLVLPIEENMLETIEQKLFDKNCKSLCLNDSSFSSETFYNEAKPKLVEMFERKFPNKSSFEK